MENSDDLDDMSDAVAFKRKRRHSERGKNECISKNASDVDGVVPKRHFEMKAVQWKNVCLCKGKVISFGLEDFSDEMLYEIFKYLDTWSILALMNTSPRFSNLLLDRRFWYDINLTKGPLPFGILEEVLARSNNKTHSIRICGPPSSQHVHAEFKQFTKSLTEALPMLQKCLVLLELQGVSLHFDYLHIMHLPPTLKRLVFRDCSVKVSEDTKSIFHAVEGHLTELEELAVEDCEWFEPYYLMTISKLPALRSLSLKGCASLSKFVPYGSMAARFGFHKLEELDLRNTPINNADLQCFGAIESLRILMLDCPVRKKAQVVEKQNVKSEPEDKYADEESSNTDALNLSFDNGQQISGISNGTPKITDKNKSKISKSESIGNDDDIDEDGPSTSARLTRKLKDNARSSVLNALKTSGSSFNKKNGNEHDIDDDNMPSTSKRAQSHKLEDGKRMKSNGNQKFRKPPPSIQDSDTDIDSDDNSPSAALPYDEDERYSSTSPPLSLSDSIKVNADIASENSDDTDDNDDDDDVDYGAGGVSGSAGIGVGAGVGSARPTETESMPSAAMREPCCSNASHSRSNSQQSNTNASPFMIIRLNPEQYNPNPPPPPPGPPPRAFILCPPQNIEGMEELRDNVRMVNQRRDNNPPCGRFLPRSYQIICMNPHNPREPFYVMHSRRQQLQQYVHFNRTNLRNRYQNQHEHLAQPQAEQEAPAGEEQEQQQRQGSPPPDIRSTFERRHRLPMQLDQVMAHPLFWNMIDPLNIQGARRHRYGRGINYSSSMQVTDRAIYSFGRATNPVEPGVIWIRNINRAQNNRLERIILRNYLLITNHTLQHLVQCSPNLVYIDISGTAVTRSGVRNFQERKPDCEVVAEHLNMTEEASETSLASSEENPPCDIDGSASVENDDAAAAAVTNDGNVRTENKDACDVNALAENENENIDADQLEQNNIEVAVEADEPDAEIDGSSDHVVIQEDGNE